MRVEIIIVGIFILVAGYLIIESTINNKKISKKQKVKIPKEKDDKGEMVEVKASIAPSMEDVERQMNSFEISMEQAAIESIADEKDEKSTFAREQAMTRAEKQKISDEAKKVEQETEMIRLKRKLDQLDLNEEEQSFVDELGDLSAEMKAVIFADLLKRKGY